VTVAPVVRAASAGAARRLVQSVVVLAVLAASTAAALLGLTLLTSANQGFFASMAATHEADLAVTINAARVSSVQMARTRHLPGVTGAAGPYPEATITVAAGSSGPGQPSGPGKPAGTCPSPGKGKPSGPGASPARPVKHGTAPGASSTGGTQPVQLTVVGRASPSGPLHDIVDNPPVMHLFTHDQGRWPTAPGEISVAMITPIRLPTGTRLTVTSAPGHPALTIVGYGEQAQPFDGGWVLPGEVPLLRSMGAPAREEMFYTFSSAGTDAQIAAGLAELKHALPAGAVVASQSWLAFEQGTAQLQSTNTPFVLAFAILALVLAVLITANVVSAAVVASYRRIGVLKSIGFTPAQVTAAYLAQIGPSALAGAIVGTVLGDRWVRPVIGVAPLIGVHVSVPQWINVTVPLGMLALTGLAATIPALRAGRLSAVAAIAAGQAPRAGHGYAPHRLAGRLALPRPVTIGLAAPFSRPARSAVTLAAITSGLAAVVMAAGLNSSIRKINHSAVSGLGQVQVTAAGARGTTLTQSQDAAILAALRAQPGTARYVAESDLFYVPPGYSPVAPGHRAPAGSSGPPNQPPGPPPPVTVALPGYFQPLQVYAYDGGSSWLGWNLVSGRWYRGPHEVDANTQLLADTRLRVGDRLRLKVNGKPVTVTITGEVFAPVPIPTLFLGWQTLGAAASTLTVGSYDVNLSPGASTRGYIASLSHALGSAYFVLTPSGPSFAFNIRPSYFRLLAWLVAALAAFGVLNSVLMATRERTRDLGVFKAVGMTPLQALLMVVCWVVVPTVIAAVIALPGGLTGEDFLVRHLAGSSLPGTSVVLPGSFVHVLSVADLALLVLAGLAIAAAGALGPAGWAAASRTTTALRAE
jgi:putative ABC transport system permease protein